MPKQVQLGLRIASVRTLRGLRQVDLAAAIGVSGQTVCNWETGARIPRAEMLRALCEELNCTSDYLLGLSDEVNERAVTRA